MKAIKNFETDNEVVSFQLVTPTIEGVKQKTELLILIETPFTKKNDIVMLFDKTRTTEIIAQLTDILSEMN